MTIAITVWFRFLLSTQQLPIRDYDWDFLCCESRLGDDTVVNVTDPKRIQEFKILLSKHEEGWVHPISDGFCGTIFISCYSKGIPNSWISFYFPDQFPDHVNSYVGWHTSHGDTGLDTLTNKFEPSDILKLMDKLGIVETRRNGIQGLRKCP